MTPGYVFVCLCPNETAESSGLGQGLRGQQRGEARGRQRVHLPPRACSVILRHKDSSLLLMSGSVTGTWNSAKGMGHGVILGSTGQGVVLGSMGLSWGPWGRGLSWGP